MPHLQALRQGHPAAFDEARARGAMLGNLLLQSPAQAR